MQIPNWPISTERELELLREVLESGRWGGHSDFVKRLEREFGSALADWDRLAPVAAERGLARIEDAAHAHGSEWAGRRAGSLGLAGSFSFQNSKVMTAGEGGMLTTNDAAFGERAWSIMDQGRKPGGGWFHHYALGSNYRITGL